MGKHRKKPVVEDAFQWFKNGDHPEDDCFRPFEDSGKIPKEAREGAIVRYFRRPGVPGDTICDLCGRIMHEHGWIDTLETVTLEIGQTVCPGDWIITGVEGEHYPCKPQIFLRDYDEVSPRYPLHGPDPRTLVPRETLGPHPAVDRMAPGAVPEAESCSQGDSLSGIPPVDDTPF